MRWFCCFSIYFILYRFSNVHSMQRTNWWCIFITLNPFCTAAAAVILCVFAAFFGLVRCAMLLLPPVIVDVVVVVVDVAAAVIFTTFNVQSIARAHCACVFFGRKYLIRKLVAMAGMTTINDDEYSKAASDKERLCIHKKI